MTTTTELRELMARATLPVQISCDDFGDPNLTGDWPEYQLAVAAINALPKLLEVAEAARVVSSQCWAAKEGYPDIGGIRALNDALAKLEDAK